MVPEFEMRVGDAERDAAAAELREHFASGRLNQDELNERLDRTFAARTRGDLRALMTDLPGSPSRLSARPEWAGAVPPGAPFAGAGTRRIGPGAGYGRPGGARYQGSQGAGRPGGGGWQHLGAGRPFAIVLFFAVFALLRRLIFGVFRRRRYGRRGPRRRC